jgi:hypothetical protein
MKPCLLLLGDRRWAICEEMELQKTKQVVNIAIVAASTLSGLQFPYVLHLYGQLCPTYASRLREVLDSGPFHASFKPTLRQSGTNLLVKARSWWPFWIFARLCFCSTDRHQG